MDKKWLIILLKKSAVILASCAYITASMTINSACTMPYYEPEQPKELERLKKQH